jgi:hypothetical protein
MADRNARCLSGGLQPDHVANAMTGINSSIIEMTFEAVSRLPLLQRGRALIERGKVEKNSICGTAVFGLQRSRALVSTESRHGADVHAVEVSRASKGPRTNECGISKWREAAHRLRGASMEPHSDEHGIDRHRPSQHRRPSRVLINYLNTQF